MMKINKEEVWKQRISLMEHVFVLVILRGIFILLKSLQRSEAAIRDPTKCIYIWSALNSKSI